VHLIGAQSDRHSPAASVLNVLQLHDIPVVFGNGRRLYTVLPARVEFDILRVIDTPEATHVRYRVRY